MTLVDCFEYDGDICEPVPAGPGYAALCAATPHAPASRHALVQRRRIHPATWVVITLAIPILCWDVWQTDRDVTLRRQAPMPHAQSSTTVSAPSVPYHRPGFRPW